MSDLTADDRLAIAELLAVYCHHLDQGRWEELRALFVEDCRLDFGKLLGVYEGADGLRRFTDTLAKIGIVMRHYTTNVVIHGDGTRAHADSYVLAFTGGGDSRSHATGRYEDELVKRDGRWRLRNRRAVIER
jgi:hypothetical protein